MMIMIMKTPGSQLIKPMNCRVCQFLYSACMLLCGSSSNEQTKQKMVDLTLVAQPGSFDQILAQNQIEIAT